MPHLSDVGSSLFRSSSEKIEVDFQEAPDVLQITKDRGFGQMKKTLRDTAAVNVSVLSVQTIGQPCPKTAKQLVLSWKATLKPLDRSPAIDRKRWQVSQAARKERSMMLQVDFGSHTKLMRNIDCF